MFFLGNQKRSTIETLAKVHCDGKLLAIAVFFCLCGCRLLDVILSVLRRRVPKTLAFAFCLRLRLKHSVNARSREKGPKEVMIQGLAW